MQTMQSNTQRQRRLRWRLAVPLLLGASMCGCASVSTGLEIRAAERGVQTAMLANGSEYAPYEMAKAQAYLQKAQEEHASARYAAARAFAVRAGEHAAVAERDAVMRRRERRGASSGEGAPGAPAATTFMGPPLPAVTDHDQTQHITTTGAEGNP